MKRARYTKRGPLAISAASLADEFPVDSARPNVEVDGVAIVDVSGPLNHHDDGFGWDSFDAIRDRAAIAFAGPARGVVLRVNSPGGEVSGMAELSRSLRCMREESSKPFVAFVDGAACSAAYALAVAADAIVVPISGRVGSVGVVNAMMSVAAAERAQGIAYAVVTSGARKADGNPHVEITEDALAAMQADVDTLAGSFFDLVAERRSMTAEQVGALQAATFIGLGAVQSGLADVVGTFEDALAMAASNATGPSAVSDGGSMDYEKALAALRALAEGDGEDADKAKKALKAIGDMDAPKGEDSADEPKGEDDKEPDGDEPKGEDDKEPDGDEKPSKPSARADVNLAAKVVELDRTVRALATREERARLLASRPDLMRVPETKAWLSRASIETVRDAVKSIPKPPAPKPAAAAAATVQPTTGETQARTDGARANRLPPAEAHELDVRMGLAAKPNAIRREGKALVFGAMTAEEARKHLATLNGGSK